jgi:hypothetical protein
MSSKAIRSSQEATVDVAAHRTKWNKIIIQLIWNKACFWGSQLKRNSGTLQ